MPITQTRCLKCLVSLKNPPNNSHFKDFHYHSIETSAPKKFDKTQVPFLPGHAALCVQGSYPMMLLSFFPPFDYWALGKNMPMNRPSTLPKHGNGNTDASSPVTSEDIIFPSIDTFLEEVKDWGEARGWNIDELKAKLDGNHGYFLNELRDVNINTFISKFVMLWGNANFIVGVVRKGIRNYSRT